MILSNRIILFLAVALFSVLLPLVLLYGGRHPLAVFTTSSAPTFTAGADAASLQRLAIIHYATSSVVLEQSLDEITLTLNVLRVLTPCSFLVFGMRHDSLMWAALNPYGKTLFLEEEPGWVLTVFKYAPKLHARITPFRTRLSQAEELLKSYRSEPDCTPSRTFLRGNRHCKLALDMMPEEVYERKWDVIMIDGPRGYFAEAPGRMAVIYSAAVMARERKGGGSTHVFLHDVDRKVEREYAEEFLCRKNLVGSTGRSWHFEIPPADNSSGGAARDTFC